MKQFLLAFSLLFSLISFAQNDQISEYVDHYSNVIPETPNATAFIKYGNTSLNHAKGSPNISIPIFQFEVDGVSIPISISYDATGIKVDELSSVVGLKWSLNAGGGIFRSINNEPDEGGWLTNNNSSLDYSWYLNNSRDHVGVQNQLKNTPYDHSPDNFSYSFGGYSGSFIFKRKDINTILKDKNDNVKIAPTNSSFSSFTASDVAGNSYSFGVFANSKELNSNTVVVGSNSSVNGTIDGYYSSWLLNKIITKNNKQIFFDYQESYDLNYTMHQKSEKVVVSERLNGENPQPVCGKAANGTHTTANFVFNKSLTSITSRPKNKLITKIYTNNIEVNFYYSDIQSNAIWKKKLDSIVITDKIKNNSKSVYFEYGLYSGSQRLKLKKVKEVINGVEKPPHVFTYNENFDIPDYESFSKDFFGYYNGKINSRLIPFTPLNYSHAAPSQKMTLADRRPSLAHLESGNLIEIKYPTGGVTKFEYELNQDIGDIFSDDKYYKNQVVLEIDANTQPTFSDGTKRRYEKVLNIPEHVLEFDYYSQSATNNGISNMWLDTSTNVIGCDNTNIQNNNNYGSIDCAKYFLFQGSNQVLGPRALGYTGGSSLSQGNYTLVLEVLESDFNNNPNLEMKISYEWYNHKEDLNGNLIKELDYSGGLRIKKVMDVDTDNKVYNRTEYEYSGLLGQKRSYDDFSENSTSAGYTMSSDFIGHSKLTKSGYFYESVTKKQIKEIIQNQIPSIPIIESFNTIYTFENDYTNQTNQSKPKGIFVYDADNRILNKTLYNYSTNQTNNNYYILGKLDYCYGDSSSSYLGYNEPEGMSFTQFENRLVKEATTQYFYPDNATTPNNITTIKGYNYNSDELITKDEVELHLTEIANLETFDINNYSSTGTVEKITTNYKYPKDFMNETLFSDLVNNKNILALPVNIDRLKNSVTIDSKYLLYDNSGNLLEVYGYNKGQGQNNSSYNYIPNNYDLLLTVTNQDGKPLEYMPKDQITTCYIWDVSKNYLLAEIKNTSYQNISSQLSSNLNIATYTKEQLITLFNNLRTANPEMLFTNYTYNPLIGVTSMTDPRGNTVYYEYDDLNRLKHVKDKDGNILSKNEYNYANQN